MADPKVLAWGEALERIRVGVEKAKMPLGHPHVGSLLLNCKHCSAAFRDHADKRVDVEALALIKACEILAKAAQAVEDGFDCRGASCPGCMMVAALAEATEALNG